MARATRHRQSPSPHPEIDESISKVLRAFALLGLVLLYFPVDLLLGTITRTEVPIGAVKSVSAASGGLQGLTVLETDTGYYALRGHATVHKGTPLILDTRLNGDQYVCIESKKVCARTSARHLSPTGAQPTVHRGSRSSEAESAREGLNKADLYTRQAHQVGA